MVSMYSHIYTKDHLGYYVVECGPRLTFQFICSAALTISYKTLNGCWNNLIKNPLTIIEAVWLLDCWKRIPLSCPRQRSYGVRLLKKGMVQIGSGSKISAQY